MNESDLLKDLLEVFPSINSVVPYVELKFRFGSKYGEVLDDILKKLESKGILTRYEFSGSVNYKSKAEIPVSLAGGGSTNSSGNSDQLKDLSKLVLEIGKKLNDNSISSMLDEFKAKYQF